LNQRPHAQKQIQVGFSGRDDMVNLSPLAETEALALIDAVNQHLGLPLLPRLCRPEDLARIDLVQYVSVDGVYAPGHLESADFEGVKLCGSRANGVKAGERYRIEGFLIPHRGSPNVGYSGAFLHCFDVEPV
jgi:hypothetical protein